MQDLVAEGKIRSLQTENEALRLHLRLALDSLKNPIPAVVVREPETGVVDQGTKGVAGEEEKENMEVEGELEEYEDEDDGYASGGYEHLADDTEEYMQGLLKDLGMFRRKIGDDRSRFLGDDGSRPPLGARINI